MLGNIGQSPLNSKMIKVTEEVYYDPQLVIGRGTYGIVYKGYHHTRNQCIAVKFIKNSKMRKNDADVREGMLMKDLSNKKNPSIIQFYGWAGTPDGIYYFMEYCEGGCLLDLIKKGLTQSQVIHYFQQLLQGLLFLKNQNVLHRDLKPENILITKEKEIKISDFGSARFKDIHMTYGFYVCTPLYAPPQFLIHLQSIYDQRCDVWSLGLILYEMLTSSPLFKVDNITSLQKQVKKFKTKSYRFQFPEHVHKMWKSMIEKILVYRFQDRPTFNQIKKLFYDIQKILREDNFNRDKRFSQIQLKISQISSSGPSNQVQTSPQQTQQKELQRQNLKTKFNFEVLVKRVQQFLKYFHEKHQVIEKLRERLRQGYKKLQNIHKYFLLFLLFAGQLSKINEIMAGIYEGQIQLPTGEKVKAKDFGERERKQLLQFFSKEEKELSKLKEERQESLKRIGVKIKQYIIRPVESKILNEFDHIQTLIEIYSNSEQVFKEENYNENYEQLLKTSQIKLRKEIFKKEPLENLQTYAYILLLGKSNSDISYSNFERGQVLKQKIVQIDKSTMNSIVKTIQSLTAS